MHQIEGEDHDQVANGDHFEVAVGAVAGPQRGPHADEGDQQRDLGREHRHIREVPARDGHPGDEQDNRGFPGGPVVKPLPFHCGGARVRSLVRELTSSRPKKTKQNAYGDKRDL